MYSSAVEQLYNQQEQNIIYNALPRTVQPGYCFGPHCHQNVEICLIQEGTCDFIINGETVTVRTGEMMVIFSHMIHSFRVSAERPVLFLQMHFCPESFLNIQPEVIENLKFVQIMTDSRSAYLFSNYSPQLLACMERICGELANTGSRYHIALANTYIAEMIFILSREIEEQYRKVFIVENPLAIRAIQFISDHIEERIGLDDVAAACKVTTRYITQIFKAHVNFTVNDYVNIAKVDRAMHLIIETDLSITKIASKLGFSSAQYFSTVFKKYTGVTPKEYKGRQNKYV